MKFYIKDFCYIKSAEEIDVSSIPPLVRRKLSPIDKAALSTMIKVFDNNVEEIVFHPNMVSIQDLIPLLHSIKKPEKYLLLNSPALYITILPVFLR